MQRPWVEAAQSAGAGAAGLLGYHLLNGLPPVDWALYGGVVVAMGVAGFVGAWIRRRRATKRADG